VVGPLNEGSALSILTSHWCREGAIPDVVRERLIDTMPAAAERAVRETILSLLDANPPPEGSVAEEEREWQILEQRSHLEKEQGEILRAAKGLLVKAPTGAAIRRFVASRILESSARFKIVFRLPKSFRRVLFPNGSPGLGVRPLIRLALLAISLVAVWGSADLFSGIFSGKLQARDEINKGVLAFRNAQYAEAVERFKNAVELDPTFPLARLYLATAYMQQYIPGAESAENEKMAKDAYDTFMQVLQQDPRNTVAIASVASLYLNQKKWDDAQQWYEKLIAVDPLNADAY